MAAAPLIPEAAAFGGGIAGPPGALIGGAIPPIVGAASGAAGLEAYRQLIANAMGQEFPQSSGEAAKSIGLSGVVGGAQELGGQLLSGASKLIGRNAYQLFKKLRPEDASVAIREGIGLTKGGVQKAEDLLMKTTQAERQLAIQARNVPISPNDIADEALRNTTGRLQGADQGTLDALAKKHNAFLKKRGTNMTPSQALDARQFNDRAVTNLRAQRLEGKIPNPTPNEIWREELSNAARRKLRDAVPAVTDPEAFRRITGSALLPSEIVPLTSAVKQIVNKAPSVGGIIFRRGGAAALGAGAGAAISPEGEHLKGALEGGLVGGLGSIAATPQMVSRAALLASSPATAAFLSNLPRLVGASQGPQP
jgi:hypothetical protein